VKPCISQVTTLPGSFADDVADYASAGAPAMEVWLTKLETHLETTSAEATQAILAEKGIVLAAAAYQGGLLLSQGEARRAAFDHFKQRLDICQQFGIGTLLVVADFSQRADGTSLGRAIASLKEAARWADGFGVKLALEFRGGDAFCTCLDTALALVGECGEPNLGVCLDLFHFYKGPSKHEDLAKLTAANLAHVQLCDVLGVPRELMADSDRVFPGEGDFRAEPVVERLKQIGYAGFVSLELMNPVFWKSKPGQVVELGLTALDRLLRSS
jgi:sugar phosphate isomerase/epimerase